MNMFLSVTSIAAPLLLITTGALVSEYAGRLAMFLECIINMGAFFCYAFSILTGNALAGTVISLALCCAIVFILERTASRFKANMFLVSLSMNLLFSAFTTFFSVLAFKSRGVLFSEEFLFSPGTMRLVTSIACYAVSAILILTLSFTKTGLIMRITGSDPEVLESRGYSADTFRCLSWIIAAFCGSLCGSVLTLRLSSYVPGMSGGRGWTALAAVFLGKKSPLLVALAVIVFALAEYASSYIQNIEIFRNIPSSILLALPYLISLLLIIIIPQKKEMPVK